MEGTLPSHYMANSNGIRRIRNRISAGYQHFLLLLPNGKLYTTGLLQSNNLGRSQGSNMLDILYPVEGLEGKEILQFESNGFFSLVLTTDGVYSFGFNNKGQLGTADIVDRNYAVKVKGFAGNNITQIAVGISSSYAIDTNGKAWSWGSNEFGQLGDRTGGDKARPFSVYNNGTMFGKKPVKICGGNRYGVILTKDGILYSFGNHDVGQLGIPSVSVSYKSIEPVKVVLSAFVNSTVIDVQCGYDHVLVLLADGSVGAWGNNNYYQMGDQSTAIRFVPKLISQIPCKVASIHTRFNTNFAICRDNTIYAWGRNDNGQTGLGTSYSDGSAMPNVLVPTKLTFVPEGRVVEIATTQFHTVLLTSEGVFHGVGRADTMFRSSSFNPNTFSVLNAYLKSVVPWQLRKIPYFETADRLYILLADKVAPTRSYNGFNMYFRNRNESEKAWRLVEFDKETNTGFPVSIYSTHYLKLDEYVYFFGGFINDHLSNAVYRAPYSDVETGWELLQNVTIPVPLAGGMTAIINNFFYIFGGISSLYNSTTGEYRPEVSDIIMRAPLSNISDWQIVPNRNLVTPIHTGQMAIVWPHVYIFGGCQTVFTSSMNIFRALLSDPTTWEMTFGLLPHYTANAAIVSTGENLVVVGGGAYPEKPGGVFIAKANKADPVGSWMAVSEVLPDFQAAAGALNGTELTLIGHDFRTTTNNLDVASLLIGQTVEITLFDN